MTGAARAVRAAALAGLLLAWGSGCGGDGGGARAGVPSATSYAGSGGGAGDEPAAELVLLRAAASLEPCPSGPAGSAADEPLPRTDLPDLELPCLGEGPAVQLATLSGPLVLNLWGSWCGPCAAEMPVLQEFHERAAGRVTLLGVDIVDADEPALRAVAERGVSYPSVVDADGEIRAGLPRPLLGAPWTLLVDADGKVVHYESGEIETVGELTDLVADHLGVRV